MLQNYFADKESHMDAILLKIRVCASDLCDKATSLVTNVETLWTAAAFL
jgi:hypothetical protein